MLTTNVDRVLEVQAGAFTGSWMLTAARRTNSRHIIGCDASACSGVSVFSTSEAQVETTQEAERADRIVIKARAALLPCVCTY